MGGFSTSRYPSTIFAEYIVKARFKKEMNMGRQCRMITKGGKQCKHPRLKGSLFCWIHLFPGHGLKFSVSLALVMLVLGGLISWGITEYYSSKSESSMFSALSPKEVWQLPVLNKIPATVVSGGIIEIGPGSTFGDVDIGPYLYSVTEDGKLLINGILWGKDGAVVVVVNNSKVFFPLGSEYDVNSDISAFEAVDAHGQPVLQMWIADEVLHVDYVAYVYDYTGSPVFEITSIGTDYQIILVEPDTKPSHLPGPPIFRYPGYKFPTMRRR